MDAALKYARILARVYSIPWAIVGSRLADIVDVLRYQSMGGKLSAAEVAEYAGLQAAGPRQDVIEGGVAVLALRGIISHRMEMVNDVSGPGGTSTQRFAQRFRQAIDDPNVYSVLMDVDTPGGAVDGVTELASEIRAARGRKPIIAATNTLAASAGYWIASQADEITITPSGEVGSIGVFAAHRDISAQLAADGENITLIHAGQFKVEGNPYEPLSDDGREEIQRKVDGAYLDFLEGVAAGRGVSASHVRESYGEGRTLGARAAMDVGMVDRIETFEQTINRLRGVTAQRRRTANRAREMALAFA